MNNRNKRATRAIVASGSLLAIIFVAIPWVDEYLRLRHDASEFSEMEEKLVENKTQTEKLARIESKLDLELESLRARSVEPHDTLVVRETLIDVVRKAGGRVRRLEITDGEERPWAIANDDPHFDNPPLYEEESEFVLHSHSVELQVDGSLLAARGILDSISNQGWLMTTKALTVTPTNDPQSPVAIELRVVVYGLGLRRHVLEDDFARTRTYETYR